MCCLVLIKGCVILFRLMGNMITNDIPLNLMGIWKQGARNNNCLCRVYFTVREEEGDSR